MHELVSFLKLIIMFDNIYAIDGTDTRMDGLDSALIEDVARAEETDDLVPPGADAS